MDILSSIFGAIWGGLKKAVDWLRNSRFADIWNYLKKIFDRVHRFIKWYNDNVVKPLEQMRQHLIQLYNHYIGPFIKLLDTIRSTVRILAVFDRKLAAAIDNAIWKLESDLYAPLYSALRRLNAVTSTLRAIITTLGLLDRSLLIQSIERDWKSVWRVLLNNGQLPAPASTSPAGTDLHQVSIDFKQFLDNGTGPFADLADAQHQQLQQALQQLS